VRFLHSLASRRRDEEQGFTLIELMVVVLIIAILIAIAIPTFLGARQRAQDRAAQSDLRNGLTAEKTIYTDAQAYTATTASLVGVESSLNWNNTRNNNLNVLTVTTGTAVAAGDVVCLSEASKSGTTFTLVDIAAGGSAGTYFGKTAFVGACGVGTVAGMGASW
jgi:type IV pilus assembly protein PilA